MHDIFAWYAYDNKMEIYEIQFRGTMLMDIFKLGVPCVDR